MVKATNMLFDENERWLFIHIPDSLPSALMMLRIEWLKLLREISKNKTKRKISDENNNK